MYKRPFVTQKRNARGRGGRGGRGRRGRGGEETNNVVSNEDLVES